MKADATPATAVRPPGGEDGAPARVGVVGDVPDGLTRALRDAGAVVDRLDAGRTLRDARRDGDGGGDGATPDVVLVVPGHADTEALRRFFSEAEPCVLLTVDADDGPETDGVARALASDEVVRLRGMAESRWAEAVLGAAERARLRRTVVRLRETVAASEARFRNTIHRIADGVVVVDEDGSIVFCNPAAERLFGRDLSALEGEPFGLPLLAGETTEVEIHRPDGSARVAELRAVETAWADASALVVSLRDITDRREAEERRVHLIREQAARAEAEAAARRAGLLAEASRELTRSLQLDGVLAIFATFLVEHVGDHVILDVFRESEGERVYRIAASTGDDPDTLHLTPAEGPSSVYVEPALREGRTTLVADLEAEGLEAVAPDAAALEVLEALSPTSMLVAPLVVGDAAYGAVTVLRSAGHEPLGERDRALVEETARRAALAAENARLYGLVEQASRAKSDFLAVISHELRTPLTGITGYAGLLLEGVGGDMTEAAESYVDGIVRNAESLLGLIDQILLFVSTDTDREEVKYAANDVREILADVAAVARPMAERSGLALEVADPRDPGPVITDGRMVRQILLHLLANAVKFTEEGTVRLEGEMERDALVFRVVDTGIGIPQDRLGDIFEPFRQVEEPRTRSVGGTGLGLNVVRNLTHLLGGDIQVESAPGEGSTFTVRIPARREPRGVEGEEGGEVETGEAGEG